MASVFYSDGWKNANEMMIVEMAQGEKTLVKEHDGLSMVPRTHMVESENL